MKTLTCRDLGGPCDAVITGATFEEMGQHSQTHVLQEINNNDAAHKAAVEEMMKKTPEEQKTMIAAWEQKFNEAPEA